MIDSSASCYACPVPFFRANLHVRSTCFMGRKTVMSKLRNIEELPGEEAELNLRAANDGIIPLIGWVEVQFQLASDTHSSLPLTVPILVARDELEHPIIGYNVIEETIKDRTQVQGESNGAVIDIINANFRELTVEC